MDVTLVTTARASRPTHHAVDYDAAPGPASAAIHSTETIHTTENHPWLTADHGWLDASALSLGERVQLANGSTAIVEGIQVVPGVGVMYDLGLQQVHAFAVGAKAYVVHNCGGPPVGGSIDRESDLLARARAARDAKAAEVGRTRATVTGGYRTDTGQVTAGCSGPGCAEDAVVRHLGGDISKIRFTEAIRPRTGQQVPICLACQTRYQPGQFPPNVEYQRGGRWGRRL